MLVAGAFFFATTPINPSDVSSLCLRGLTCTSARWLIRREVIVKTKTRRGSAVENDLNGFGRQMVVDPIAEPPTHCTECV